MSLTSPFKLYLDTNYTPSDEEVPLIKKIVEDQNVILGDIDAELHGIERAILPLQLRQRELASLRTVHQSFRGRHCALLRPIRALPLDILSEIFLSMVPTVEAWKGLAETEVIPHPVVTFTHVCRQWRGLALSTPLLWTNVPVDPLPD